MSTAPHADVTSSARSLPGELLDSAGDEELRAVLEAARSWCTDGLPDLADISNFDAATAALQTARRQVRAAVTDRDGADERLAATGPLLERLADMSAVVEQARSDHQRRQLHEVSGVLAELEDMTTPAQLMEAGAAAMGRLGFTRSLVSRLSDYTWVTESCHVIDDRESAARIKLAGQEHPQQIVAKLPEHEVVRRRQPILVPSVDDLEVVHVALLRATNTRAYVAAPVTTHSRVVGFLHCDRPGKDAVTAFDADLLGVFGRGFSFALERALLLQDLAELRSKVGGYADSLTALAADPTDTGTLDLGASGPAPAQRPQLQLVASDGQDCRLTRREMDVMQLMVTGATNRRIANRLVISEATVKGHVKQILRKLGAVNRTEAIAQWHAADARAADAR